MVFQGFPKGARQMLSRALKHTTKRTNNTTKEQMPTATLVPAPRGYNDNAEERSAVLYKILDKYSRADGRVDFSGAFRDHPDWAAQLGWSNDIYKGRAYAKLSALKNAASNKPEERNGNETNGAVKLSPKRRSKGRHHWTEEEVSLARQIQKDPTYRDGKGVNWRVAMAAHPEWAQTLQYDKRKAFMAFIVRLRSKPDWKGKESPPQTALVKATTPRREIASIPQPEPIRLQASDLVEIKGRVYRVAAIAEKLEDYTANLCPTCGLNIEALNHGYNIAVKASRHFQEQRA